MHGSHLFMFMFVCMLIYARILELAVASQSLAEASRSLAEPRRSLAEPREASRSLAKPRRSRSECCEASRSSQSLAKASRKPRGASQNVQLSAFARNFEVVVPNLNNGLHNSVLPPAGKLGEVIPTPGIQRSGVLTIEQDELN